MCFYKYVTRLGLNSLLFRYSCNIRLSFSIRHGGWRITKKPPPRKVVAYTPPTQTSLFYYSINA